MMIPKVRNPEETGFLKSELPSHAAAWSASLYGFRCGSSFLYLKLAADDI